MHGPSALKGAEVIAHDLRTGIALVLAGLAAEGETVVSPGYLIDRGHASVAARLTALGADITAGNRQLRLRTAGVILPLVPLSPFYSRLRNRNGLADDLPFPLHRARSGSCEM